MEKEILDLGKLISKDVDRYISNFKVIQNEKIFFIKIFTQKLTLTEEDVKVSDSKFFNEISGDFFVDYASLNGNFLLVKIHGGIGFKDKISELIRIDCTGDYDNIFIV